MSTTEPKGAKRHWKWRVQFCRFADDLRHQFEDRWARVRERLGLTPYMLEYDQSLRGIRGILDEYCGVSIYRDGFRVHPYGEKGVDWLSLDTRSRQTPTKRLANNQIVSAIRVSRDGNPDLLDRTTREGLVHNQEYQSLIDWFTRVLDLLVEQRYIIRPREETKPEEKSTLFEPFDMSDVVTETDKQRGKKHPGIKMVKNPFPVLFINSGTIIRKAKSEAVFERRKLYVNLATLAISVMTRKPVYAVVHEVRDYLPEI